MSDSYSVVNVIKVSFTIVNEQEEASVDKLINCEGSERKGFKSCPSAAIQLKTWIFRAPRTRKLLRS